MLLSAGLGLTLVQMVDHPRPIHALQSAGLVFFFVLFVVGATVLAGEVRAARKLGRRLSLLSEMSIEINRAILLNEDLELIYSTILDYLFRIFENVKYGSVLVLDDAGYLTFAAGRGFSPEYMANFRLKLEQSFLYQEAGGDITSARLISKKTIDKAGIFFHPEEWQYKAVISSPMFANKRLYGMLNLDSNSARTFVPEDVHIVEQFSAQIEVCLLARGRYRLSIERARVDGLTGLYTRRYFVEQFETEVTRCEQYGDTFLLVIFDADGLKRVNDVFGHRAGDRMLVAIADALRTGHRKTDIIGRNGGDEFIAVYHGSDPESMERNLASVLAHAEAAPLEFEGNRIPVGFSFGLAAFPEEGRTLEELLSAADSRMYAMKKRRKGESA